jgi:pyridine nucleotide-disulfide oxidoreductase family protein
MTHLIAVGGGHAHLFLLESLIRKPRPDLRIMLISPGRWQYYSGMLPGWMAGRYDISACRLDLAALAARAGVEYVDDRVIELNATTRTIRCLSGVEYSSELISLDVGSETPTSELAGLGERLLPVKPLPAFVETWPKILAAARARAGFSLVVAGGGAGGVELALAAAEALRCTSVRLTLLAGSQGLLPGHAPAVRHRIRAALARWHVDLQEQRATGQGDGVVLADGRFMRADAVLAATGAQAPAWLAASGLTRDSQGFVAVNAEHRSVSHLAVFAVGDVCSRQDVSSARSGVQAVRAGPVLAHNLLAVLDGQPLKPYIPRRRSLYLLATGQGRAVLSWGSLGFEAAWVWRWKDAIDRRFIQRFGNLL